jgi:ferredoxin
MMNKTDIVEVYKQWLDGAEIQWYQLGQWVDLPKFESQHVVVFHKDVALRIKPKAPEKPTVEELVKIARNAFWDCPDSAIESWEAAIKAVLDRLETK